MSKLTKEGCRVVSIFEFKKWNAIRPHNSGIITWTSHWGDKNSIGYEINLNNTNNGIIRLYYTATNGSTGEKTDIDQTYPIISSRCNFIFFTHSSYLSFLHFH